MTIDVRPRYGKWAASVCFFLAIPLLMLLFGARTLTVVGVGVFVLIPTSIALVNAYATWSGPARADDEGFELRSGERVRWRQVTAAKVTDIVRQNARTRQMVSNLQRWMELTVGDRTVRLSPQELSNGDEVLRFFLNHVPPEALRQAK